MVSVWQFVAGLKLMMSYIGVPSEVTKVPFQFQR